VKLGLENKKKTIAAAALAALALFMVVRAFMGGDEGSTPPANPAATAARPSATALPAARKTNAAAKNKPHPLLAQTLDPTLRFDLLKSSEEVTYKGSGRDIFHSQAPPPEIPQPVSSPLKKGNTAPPPPPPPPPINLKLYGYAQKKNGEPKRVFLSSGEDIFVAKEGDIVNRRYRILKIGNNSVEVEDVLTNNKQTLYQQQS
jgi:hypothetical protein